MSPTEKEYPPLSDEEWTQIEAYQTVPFSEKLTMLDRIRSFMFQLWQENPECYEAAQKYRRGEI